MSETESPTPTDTKKMSRRAFIKRSAAAVLGTGAIIGRKEIAIGLGSIADKLLAPEKIVSRPISILTPRENDTPSVLPQEVNEAPTEIPLNYEQQGEKVAIQFPTEMRLHAQHTTDMSLIPQGKLTDSGTGIITTAEGPSNGKQEYCQFFKNDKNKLIAVGYEKGLYAYDHQRKEWVRLLNTDQEGETHIAQTTQTIWNGIQQLKPTRMLIQDIAEGNNVLTSVEYHPWATILPSTKVPDGEKMVTSPEYYSQSTEEVINSPIATGKRYFVTKYGDVVDRAHLWAKSGETLDLFCQLYDQFLKRTLSPIVSIEYDAAKNASYQFSVNPTSLAPENILDTTFQIMMQVTYLMEGITQRYVQEKTGLFKPKSGMSPEDMFSNALATTEMLTLIRKPEMFQHLIQAIATKTDISELKEQLSKQMMRNVVEKYGVRSNPQIDPHMALLGMHPLIPSKVSDSDSQTPTHLNLQGIALDNPNVQYQVTGVPVLQEEGGLLVQKIDNAVSNLFTTI